VSLLIDECEAARRYNWKKERDARRRDSDALAECKNAATASSRLAKLLKTHADQFGLAVGMASIGAKVYLVKNKDEARNVGKMSAFGQTEALRLSSLLAEMHAQFSKKNVLAKSMLMQKTTRYGPLHFPKGVGNKPVSPEVALAIYLVAQIRHYELSRSWGLQVGARIPSRPRAKWSLIEKWVTSALDSETGFRKSAEKLLAAHPDLELWHY
jgi:hypothetical protein